MKVLPLLGGHMRQIVQQQKQARITMSLLSNLRSIICDSFFIFLFIGDRLYHLSILLVNKIQVNLYRLSAFDALGHFFLQLLDLILGYKDIYLVAWRLRLELFSFRSLRYGTNLEIKNQSLHPQGHFSRVAEIAQMKNYLAVTEHFFAQDSLQFSVFSSYLIMIQSDQKVNIVKKDYQIIIQMKPIIMLLLLINILTTTDIPKSYREGKSVNIQGNIDQLVNIEVPFKHVISVDISDKKLKDKIIFSPNIFMLKQIISINNPEYKNKTLLEQLRTPFSNEFSHLFKIQQYLIAFRHPNHFSIFQEQLSSFKLIKYLNVQELKGKQLKFHKVNNQYIMVLIQNQKILFLNEKTHVVMENPFNSTNVIICKQFNKIKDNKQIKILYFNKTINIIKNNSIHQSKTFLPHSKIQININSLYLQERKAHTYFWIIDSKKGIYWIESNKEYEPIGQPLLIVDLPHIVDIDIKYAEEIRLLLTCKNDTHVYFIKTIIIYNKQNKPEVIKHFQPQFAENNVKKYLYLEDKVISLEKESLNVFVPSIKKDQKDIKYIKSWIKVPSIRAYEVVIQTLQGQESLYLYSIDNKKVTKFNLLMEKYNLQLKYHEQINTKFDLTIDYVCQNAQQNSIKQICEYSFQVNLNIHPNILSYIRWKGIFLGFIFLLISILIVLIFLCYKKYSTIQKNVWSELRNMTNINSLKL